MPNVTCDSCGGNDFYYDSGYYFCKECQTQTQDIQEHAFEIPAQYVQKRKEVKKKNEKQEERITSWECYNYILLGLVKELIALGASENLKSTIEVLWFQYLKKIEVIGKPNEPPKLPAYNSKVDAEIIYSRRFPKKKSAPAPSTSQNDKTNTPFLDATALHQERVRQKKLLSKREAEILSKTQQTEASLLNRSLGSLKTKPQENDPSKYLRFHNKAEKEILKTMSRAHFRKHCKDIHSTMTCHKFSMQKVSTQYSTSPLVLSRSKLYSIVYLGLLINKEKVQLGDMLRYIREGYLSYDNCDHFFPEEFIEKRLNICTFTQGHQPMTSQSLRNYTAKMTTFLNVAKYVPVQNLCELSKRYCQELNLPDEIHDHVLNLLSRSEPKMSVYNSEHSTPNYEARAISFIIFVLKLFFGLDDATEFELSNLANDINNNFDTKKKKPFNLETWLKYVEYRKLLMNDHHFPTKYLDDDYNSPDNFINFMTWSNERTRINDELPLDMELIKDLLQKINNTSDCNTKKLHFAATLTPFKDYTQILLNSAELSDKNYLFDLLNIDFSNTSLNYINFMQSYKSLLLPNEKLIYKHGGKNDNILITNLFNKNIERCKKKRVEDTLINVTFAKSDKQATIKTFDTPPPKRLRDDSENIVRNFLNANAKKHESNKEKNNEKQSNFQNPNFQIDNDTNIEIDNHIYNTTECFWVNLQDISELTIQEVENFFKAMPTAFRVILRECARVIEQTERDLYIEYSIVEAYLCYCYNIKSRSYSREKVVNVELTKVLNKAKKLW